MKENDCEPLTKAEHLLAIITSRCEYSFAGMGGAVGFNYQSVKDNLKWNGLSRKKFAHIILAVGRYLVLGDEDFGKAKSKMEY